MKHFVSLSLLAVLLATVGCVHYGAATNPYYTSYYSAYDTYNHCYYHPSRFYRCCGPNLGYRGDGHVRGGGSSPSAGSTSNFGGGVQHGSGSHRGGSGSPHGGSTGHHSGGGSHHSSGGSHSHSSSSSSSSGHHK